MVHGRVACRSLAKLVAQKRTETAEATATGDHEQPGASAPAAGSVQKVDTQIQVEWRSGEEASVACSKAMDLHSMGDSLLAVH